MKNSKQGVFPKQAPWNSQLATSLCRHWPKHTSPGPPTCSFRRETGQPWPCGPARAYALPGGQCHPFQEQTSGAKQGKAHLWTWWPCTVFQEQNGDLLAWIYSLFSMYKPWPGTREISVIAVPVTFLPLLHHVSISSFCPATTLVLQQMYYVCSKEVSTPTLPEEVW